MVQILRLGICRIVGREGLIEAHRALRFPDALPAARLMLAYRGREGYAPIGSLYDGMSTFALISCLGSRLYEEWRLSSGIKCRRSKAMVGHC
jgi:hypothetical protein